ncbi:hypothetical protein [Fusobacterium perfoetens]|uniref:hypothetical protein n=1 Tax=Fusobacterium perfoetens TaxID=852 RepID=UPI0026F1F83E|nr:hypothetical protein [Fusobacterium perfoetens]
MKKYLMIITCFLLIISINIYGATKESENKMIKNNFEFGLTINDTYFSVPSSLKQLIDDGWTISNKTPYFLKPLVGEDYYAIRTNWSLSKDGKGILNGGKIIRLLEKNGVFLEVKIANQDIESDEPYKKIEDGVVNSITVFYDKKCSSIKINNKELNSLTPDILFKDYTRSDGWEHVPTNYRNHPEFGISLEHSIVKIVDNKERNITIYFDLENRAFKVNVSNE